MKKFLFLLILIASLYFGARISLVWNKPNSDSTARVTFTIERGSSLNSISKLLQDKELIRDAFVFRLYAKWQGLASKFQAGDYIMQKNLTFAEIADLLQHGKGTEIKVTIPEGSTISQIDDILAKKSLITLGEFEKCTNFCNLGFRVDSLEGYLFPSTYYVNPNNFSEKLFIRRLYNTFQQQINPLRKSIAESGHTLNEIVIMASMIEREANNTEEMPVIAGILWKRLKEGIHLGVDATTRYELNQWKKPLYTDDFENNSPYNTRKTLGLPPTAISNPSLPALKAAIFPQDSSFYYYLHDMNGQIHYGKTLEEHNENKRLYLN